MNAPFLDLRSEHRSEPAPPEPNCLVADIDTALEQKILDLAQRQRLADIHHHRQADDLGRTVEIMERVFHPSRLKNGLVCLKPFCSDTAGDS
jgi:DNA-binding IscR family transcriptional regulator